MTGEEKRRLLKEQYKQDLKARKEFLDKAKQLRSQQNINKALGSMLDGMSDDSDDWISQLNQESALTEAKIDLAMEGEQTEKELQHMASEAEMEKLSAAQLVERMKREMGLLPPEEELKEEPVEETKAEAPSEEKKDEPSPQDPPPRKGKSMGDF